MIWSIAWKNVWRNKVRSMVVIVAFVLGIFGAVYMVAFMYGMMDSRIKLAIGNETSHIQVHHNKFLENNELKYTLVADTELLSAIEAIPEVRGVSPRIKIMGMASTSGNAAGVVVNGIEVEKEKLVSGISQSIIENGGSFFGSDRRKPIVIGEKLANTLKLVYYSFDENDLLELSDNRDYSKVFPLLDSLSGKTYRTELAFENALEAILQQNDFERLKDKLKEEAKKYRLKRKIVLSFQSLDGSIVYDAFRVEGVFRTANTSFDGMTVFVKNSDIASVASLQESQFSQVAILCNSAEDDEIVAGQVRELMPGNEVQTWEEILPEAAMYSSFMEFLLFIVLTIALLALGFGIVNTMLMAVLERVKELGMLMAVGMNKRRVFRMIMLETIFLGLTGGSIGLALSYLVIMLTGKSGIDLSALYKEGLEALGFPAMVYPTIGPEALMEIIILVILTGFLASIYPARKALKLNPSEALRVDM